MRTLVTTALLAALALAAAPRANAADTGWFTRVDFGSAHHSVNNAWYSDSNNSTGGSLSVGWRTTSLGAEIGYTNLGNYYSGVSLTGSDKLRAHGLTAGINTRFRLADRVYFDARGGAFFGRLTDQRTSFFPTTSSTRNNLSTLGWYAGVGLSYAFSSHWSAGGHISYYHASKSNLTLNTRMYTMSVEYRF